MAPVLVARTIVKSYSAVPVLKGVSVELGAGEIQAIIGPNGAGKTTLFRVLSGEVAADAGTVVFGGRDISRLDGFQRVRLGIGRTFQVARVFAELTAAENLVIALEARRFAGRLAAALFSRVDTRADVLDEVDGILRDVGVAAQRDVPAGILAYGERKRLELGMALALKPRVLLLDEPMAGLSPGDRTAAVALIARIVREYGVSVLLTEHDMNVVFTLASRITVLNYGEIIASGSQQEIRSSSLVRDVYLGHEMTHA